MRAKLLAALGMASLAIGCGEAGTGDGGQAGLENVGRLELALAPSQIRAQKDATFQKAVVSVAKVTVHSNKAGWVTVSTTPVVVDLLRLAESQQDLGLVDLPPGKITQVRLYVSPDPAAYVVTGDGEQHPLRVPSGEQSGIKIKGNWNLGACEQVALQLNVDHKKSIWIHARGNHTDYILRPVIHAGRHVVSRLEGCEEPGLETPPIDAPRNPHVPGYDKPGPRNDRPGRGHDEPCDHDDGEPNGAGGQGGDFSETPGDGSGGSDEGAGGSGGAGDDGGAGGTDGGDPGAGGSSGGGTGTPCGTHADCAVTHYCGDQDVCAPKFDPGASCELDEQCAQGCGDDLACIGLF